MDGVGCGQWRSQKISGARAILIKQKIFNYKITEFYINIKKISFVFWRGARPAARGGRAVAPPVVVVVFGLDWDREGDASGQGGTCWGGPYQVPLLYPITTGAW